MNTRLDAVRAVSAFMNVTGAEAELAEDLLCKLDPAGDRSKIDEMGSLFIRGKNEKTLISAAMDFPGYLYLMKEEGKNYLVPTVSDVGKKQDGLRVQGKDRKIYPLHADKDHPHFYLLRKKLRIGDPFKEITSYDEKEGAIRGVFAARYALIDLLAGIAKQNGPSVLFAAQTCGNAPTEYNALPCTGAERTIFLGRFASRSEKPLAVVRDGRHFSDAALTRAAVDAGFAPVVSEKPVTKAALCGNLGIPTLTLALPCRKPDTAEESVSVKAMDAFSEALGALISRLS